MTGSNRREFLQSVVAASAIAGAATSALANHGSAPPTSAAGVVMDRVVPKMAKVRFGFIGVGMRGAELLRLTLAIEGAEVVTVCDIDKEALAAASRAVAAASGRASRSEEHTSELQSLMRISYAVFCLKKKTEHV